MPKLQNAKFALFAALCGGLATLLACLLCWGSGYSVCWADSTFQPGATIGNAEISESPLIQSKDIALSPVATTGQNPDLETAQNSEPQSDQPADQKAGSSGNSDDDGALPPAGQQSGAAPTQAGKEATGRVPTRVLQQPNNKAVPSATGAGAAADPDADEGAANGRVQLFGTVEFKRPLSTLPGWLDLLKRNHMDPIFTPGKVFKKGVTWESFRAKAPAKNSMELLRYVNSFWNSWPYVEDMTNWRQEDYWEIPQEFLKKSGDCEDYAIIKYFTLKELGVPPESMRIVVVRDTIRNLAHAVLVVYLQNNAFILDNLSNSVLSHTTLRQYRPQYSVNEFGRWAHLKGRKLE